MKTLTSVNITVTGNKFTMTADIVEKEFSQFPVQQQTIGHIEESNLAHHFHIQISQEAVFVKTPGKRCGLALDKPTMVQIAKAVEPAITYAPFLKSPLTKELTPEINSELNPDFQWQIYADKTWSDIAGQTAKSLEKTAVAPGSVVRLKASSAAGVLISNPVKI